MESIIGDGTALYRRKASVVETSYFCLVLCECSVLVKFLCVCTKAWTSTTGRTELASNYTYNTICASVSLCGDISSACSHDVAVAALYYNAVDTSIVRGISPLSQFRINACMCTHMHRYSRRLECVTWELRIQGAWNETVQAVQLTNSLVFV